MSLNHGEVALPAESSRETRPGKIRLVVSLDTISCLGSDRNVHIDSKSVFGARAYLLSEHQFDQKDIPLLSFASACPYSPRAE